MSKLRVGVLRGGPSSEYEVSLKTGHHVLQSLSCDRYIPQDIIISRDGEWYTHGSIATPEKVLRNIDVIFNALHGEYGEDGQVQTILNTFQIPYTGSGALASSIAMNKPRAKDIVSKVGIQVPLHVIVKRSPYVEKDVTNIFRTFPQPVVVKPLNKGSSVGISIIHSYHELIDAVIKALEDSQSVLVEEHIQGREITCGVIDNFRGEELYTLMPIEIVLPSGKDCFDYEAKYNDESDGGAQLRCPAHLTAQERQNIENITRTVHEALGLRHYSRSDFIMTPQGIYFLEVNTLPGLTKHSLIPHALEEAGCDFGEFTDHLINLAVAKN